VAYTIFDYILDQVMCQMEHNQLDHYTILHQLLQNVEHALSENDWKGFTHCLAKKEEENENILYLLEKSDHIS
jgi:hypothetical protein